MVRCARPDLIRIDSVHHGDLDGTKGLYYIELRLDGAHSVLQTITLPVLMVH